MYIAGEFTGQHKPLLEISIDDVYQRAAKQAGIACGDEPRLEAAIGRVLADDATFAAIAQKAAEIVWLVSALVEQECKQQVDVDVAAAAEVA